MAYEQRIFPKETNMKARSMLIDFGSRRALRHDRHGLTRAKNTSISKKLKTFVAFHCQMAGGRAISRIGKPKGLIRPDRSVVLPVARAAARPMRRLPGSARALPDSREPRERLFF